PGLLEHGAGLAPAAEDQRRGRDPGRQADHVDVVELVEEAPGVGRRRRPALELVERPPLLLGARGRWAPRAAGGGRGHPPATPPACPRAGTTRRTPAGRWAPGCPSPGAR